MISWGVCDAPIIIYDLRSLFAFETSKLEVDPPGDLKRRKVPVLESISGGTHLRVIQTN